MKTNYKALNIVDIALIIFFVCLAIWGFQIGKSDIAVYQLLLAVWIALTRMNRRNAYHWREIAHKYRELLENNEQK